MDRFQEFKVKVFDKFIDKFAERYVQQRSSVDPEVLRKAAELDSGMNPDALMKIIRKNSCYVDSYREAGKRPPILNDIYRSDLGELLTTYYFEEKLPEGERYVIPLKNISSRELSKLPGRGFDAVGYLKEADGKYNLLLSEAKVSEQRRSPPSIVDTTDDSIYNTHKGHHDDMPMVLNLLSDYLRKQTSAESFTALACIVVLMDCGQTDKFKVTYGCGLVRDASCVNETSDFGKMKTNVYDFRPGDVDFAIFTFTEKTISETVDLFYQKVREIVG